jgi:hypothetical protein
MMQFCLTILGAVSKSGACRCALTTSNLSTPATFFPTVISFWDQTDASAAPEVRFWMAAKTCYEQTGMRRLHFYLGIATLVVFVLTGQYMARYHEHLEGMGDLPRMLFRSRHIYILFAGLINLSIGTYLRARLSDWRGKLQVFASALIILATFGLVVAFVYEPLPGDLQNTPFSRLSVIVIAIGTVTHAIAGTTNKKTLEN